ncbi:hypothetical protein D3Z35_11090 [Enterococcus faecalis]|nr:hypothetical protein CNQ40_15135 [Enterococcus faecalis]EGO8446016.1 hypothetical protein [Enterococcus faecalis]EGO8597989.1 hypothetical protein [Enterococcus faecalis]EGO8846605.1 hypothetical protein [Enterococcus faecalis]EGO8929293.1 hypothetical protein [Enterococcus faecalis]
MVNQLFYLVNNSLAEVNNFVKRAKKKTLPKKGKVLKEGKNRSSTF